VKQLDFSDAVEDAMEIQNNIAYYNKKVHKLSPIDKRLLLGAFYRQFSEEMQ
jgi:hypothetical protein